MFAALKLTKNPDFDKDKYSGYVIGFDACGSFSLSNGSGFCKTLVISDSDMSSSGHVDNREKDIVIFGKCPSQGLDNTTTTAEKEYAINFSEQQKKFCLSFYSNGANGYSYLLTV